MPKSIVIREHDGVCKCGAVTLCIGTTCTKKPGHKDKCNDCLRKKDRISRAKQAATIDKEIAKLIEERNNNN